MRTTPSSSETNTPKRAMVSFHLCEPTILFYLSSTQCNADDYYVFTPFEKVPTRIPLASFNEIDFVRDVLRPSNGPNAARGNRSAPVVELESGKSGLKLVFDTNRALSLIYSSFAD
jgi:hypothetical protein